MNGDTAPEKEYRDHWRISVINEEGVTEEIVRMHTRTLYGVLARINQHKDKFHHLRIAFRNPYSPVVRIFDASDREL
jgi:hypothetical protein